MSSWDFRFDFQLFLKITLSLTSCCIIPSFLSTITFDGSRERNSSEILSLSNSRSGTIESSRTFLTLSFLPEINFWTALGNSSFNFAYNFPWIFNFGILEHLKNLSNHVLFMALIWKSVLPIWKEINSLLGTRMYGLSIVRTNSRT